VSRSPSNSVPNVSTGGITAGHDVILQVGSDGLPRGYRSIAGVLLVAVAMVALIFVSRVKHNSPSGFLATAIGAALVVLLLFSAAEFDLSPRMRDLAIQWLMPRTGIPRVSTAEAFSRLFEAVFGDKHFSAYCFVRAAIASVVFLSIAIISMRWVLGATVQFTLATWVTLALYACTVNVFGDYFALYITRVMLTSYRRGMHILLVLSIDFFGTVAVFVTTVCLAILTLWGVAALNGTLRHNGESFGQIVMAKIVQVLEQPYLDLVNPTSTDLLQPVGYRRLLYASFSTTFVTSIWLWAALFLSPLFRLLVWAGGTGLTAVGALFEVHKAPFVAMGYLGALLVLFGAGAFWGIGEAMSLLAGVRI